MTAKAKLICLVVADVGTPDLKASPDPLIITKESAIVALTQLIGVYAGLQAAYHCFRDESVYGAA